MPTKKPIKAAGGSDEAAKPAQKTAQTATKKAAANLESDEQTETQARKPRPPVIERKMTPQRQAHLQRARRRKWNQRIVATVAILVVVAVIAVAAWQLIEKGSKTTVTSAGATTTAQIKATATYSVLCPDTPPAVTGTPTTTSDGLQYIDTQVGTGNTVKEGDTVNVNYNLWTQADDVNRDCSYKDSPGKPAQFTLTTGSIIQGWIEGLSGMKVGGKRRLVIPPSLAYGDQAQGSIPANSTLIFDVEVVSIGSGS
ncbi:MAG TPA: FKBP-type peptidyl-prolyl cis-trans isomerase [Ktedonobacterales bacterium]|nr:FKBP-type peptidyl-prolyl cis-trans isomerase [Ktedonobacterales bacterium]